MYSNGQVPLSRLVHVAGNIWLPAGTLARWRFAVEYAQAKWGFTLRITGQGSSSWNTWNGYRPLSAQKLYRNAYGNMAAIPGTSSHGGTYRGQEVFAIDVDNWAALGWARFVEAMHAAGLTVNFVSPREEWHVGDFNDPWTAPAFAGGGSGGEVPVPKPIDTTILEESMANPIINVVPNSGDDWRGGTVYIGLDDGSFQQLRPPFATNIRGIIGKAFFGGDGNGSKDTIPTLSQADFNALGPVWATMCKGRTDAAAVWAEGVHAQDAEGRVLYIDDAGKITTTVTSKPLKFTAAGFLASTNALANDAAG